MSSRRGRDDNDDDYKDTLEMQEHVPVPKKVYITRDVMTWRCSGSHRNIPGARRCSMERREKRTQNNCRRLMEEELRGIVKGEGAQLRVKECHNKADDELEPGGRSEDEGQTDAPTTSPSSSSNAAPASSSSSSGETAGSNSIRDGNGSSRVDNKMKADGEHPEDPEREDGKWTKTEVSKRTGATSNASKAPNRPSEEGRRQS